MAGNLPLFCGVCSTQSWLYWPILRKDNEDESYFDYYESIKKYIRHYVDKSFDINRNYTVKQLRIEGRLLYSKRNTFKRPCPHVIGFGKIACQHCGKLVTPSFDPKNRKCPSCNTSINVAIGTVGAVKIY
mmetsp:Transcript_10391/g.12924  ORF Transcript_10391/g.12924 Transcript_10391/m.12924 type:complete len:130 (-) Transcript_10391:1279-1668(-)